MTKKIKVFGLVQGVGFRYFIYRHATELGVKGYVRNCSDGSVEIVAQGDNDILEKLIYYAKTGPRYSEVERIEIEDLKDEKEFNTFRIVEF